MTEFEDKIERWLSRAVPDQSVNECLDLPIVLASDIGAKRSENQDRVGAMTIGPQSTSGRALVAIAVADGMGGMRDGARCATLAISSFFYALTLYRSCAIEQRIIKAIAHSDDVVHAFSKGKGGSTLSAVVIDHELRPFIAHVGDSRVYALLDGGGLERLTVDDSLAEVVGGYGRELLQYIGMGEGMKPHVQPVTGAIRHLAITSDGVHYIEASTLSDLLANAQDLKAASDRLLSVARWCGGHDNASTALIDVRSLVQKLSTSHESGIQLWDPYGTIAVMWIKADSKRAASRRTAPRDAAREASPVPDQPATRQPKQKLAKPDRRGKDKKRKNDIQLEIHVESSSDVEKLS